MPSHALPSRVHSIIQQGRPSSRRSVIALESLALPCPASPCNAAQPTLYSKSDHPLKVVALESRAMPRPAVSSQATQSLAPPGLALHSTLYLYTPARTETGKRSVRDFGESGATTRVGAGADVLVFARIISIRSAASVLVRAPLLFGLLLSAVAMFHILTEQSVGCKLYQ